jgi:hypothetical protein
MSSSMDHALKEVQSQALLTLLYCVHACMSAMVDDIQTTSTSFHSAFLNNNAPFSDQQLTDIVNFLYDNRRSLSGTTASKVYHDLQGHFPNRTYDEVIIEIHKVRAYHIIS